MKCAEMESTYASYDGHKLCPRRLVCEVSMLTTCLDIVFYNRNVADYTLCGKLGELFGCCVSY